MKTTFKLQFDIQEPCTYIRVFIHASCTKWTTISLRDATNAHKKNKTQTIEPQKGSEILYDFCVSWLASAPPPLSFSSSSLALPPPPLPLTSSAPSSACWRGRAGSTTCPWAGQWRPRRGSGTTRTDSPRYRRQPCPRTTPEDLLIFSCPAAQ